MTIPWYELSKYEHYKYVSYCVLLLYYNSTFEGTGTIRESDHIRVVLVHGTVRAVLVSTSTGSLYKYQ